MHSKPAKDFVLRIVISFLIACLLWVFAITDTDPTVTQTFSSIPITFQNADALNASGLTYEASVNSVDIQLYGRTIQMSKITSSDIYAVVDLSNLRQTGSYSVEVIIKGVADNISIVNISPQYINISVSEIVEDTHSFTLDFSGDLADGYVITSYQADVNLVSLSGSTSALSEIANVKGTVDVQDKSDDFSATVTLKAYDEENNLLPNVEITPQEVEVYISIGTTKDVVVQPITKGDPADGYIVTDISVSPTTITIAGDPDLLSDVDVIKLLEINLQGKSTSFTVQAELDLPKEIVKYSTDPINVTVTIEELSSKTLTFETLQVRNIPTDFQSDLTSFSGVSMVIEGLAAELDALTTEEVAVYIDLSQIKTVGNYVLPIQYTLPDTINLKSISLTEVHISVTNK